MQAASRVVRSSTLSKHYKSSIGFYRTFCVTYHRCKTSHRYPEIIDIKSDITIDSRKQRDCHEVSRFRSLPFSTQITFNPDIILYQT